MGPSIGLIPMIIANVFTDPHRMLIAVVYMLIIQQVDGNILYPRIVGGVMKVHPITILVFTFVIKQYLWGYWYDCRCTNLFYLKRNF